LEHISRPYSRYGISPDAFIQALERVREPQAILVTSLMTYWYPGVKETIGLAREIHPGVPVILGGIYARLCPEHAREQAGADAVVREPDAGHRPLAWLEAHGISAPEPLAASRPQPYPAFDLLTRLDYVCLLTSSGCPFRCRYCASRLLSPHFSQRDPADVLGEILYWHRAFGVRDFAFYDDALLIGADAHLSVILTELLRQRLDLRFHTPNALHAREVTAEIASLMKRAGFRTIRLGLESADFSLHRKLDDKVAEGDFERAVARLLEAGFDHNQIGAYVLMGLPGQSVDSVLKTLDLVDEAGAVPYLSEYSPIPGTALWEEAVLCSDYELLSEPLFHNNTLLPCWSPAQRRSLPLLKRRVSQIREKYRHLRESMRDRGKGPFP
jgi:tRNA A37 methylthiotransferase MiaB